MFLNNITELRFRFVIFLSQSLRSIMMTKISESDPPSQIYITQTKYKHLSNVFFFFPKGIVNSNLQIILCTNSHCKHTATLSHHLDPGKYQTGTNAQFLQFPSQIQTHLCRNISGWQEQQTSGVVSCPQKSSPKRNLLSDWDIFSGKPLVWSKFVNILNIEKGNPIHLIWVEVAHINSGIKKRPKLSSRQNIKDHEG